MKPFNLQEALAGKPVVTRDGRKVEQLFYLDKAENEFKLRAVVDGSITAYTDNGCFYSEVITESDLFMAPEKREYWAGVCEKEGYIYYKIGYSEDEVRKAAQAAMGKVLAVTKIYEQEI